MSFSKTNKPVKLPVFKDKVMYINATNNKNKLEQSYVISASFKGILRLSPNNFNTINEKNPIELTIQEDASISSSYSDAIVFEDGALSSTKTNADIRERFIIGSDSDGYLVNFRFSKEDLEFDNLGVIGIAKTNELVIYSDDNMTDTNAFVLGNTIMPSLPNELDSNRADLIEVLEQNNQFDKKPENYDEIEIDIRGKGDKSYLLHGYKDPQTGMRKFQYKRSQQFIRDVIMETLLSFQSVPTGSIHWFPVTLEQYLQLISENQFPNRYFKKTSTGVDTQIPADPIIRDYLLCDGRKYKSEEFPELAKILWKEEITYWDSEGNIKKHINGGSKTEKGVTIFDNYFRVPDLRTKFISYVYAPSVLNALEGEPTNVQRFKKVPENKTGLYTPDNSPRKSNLEKEDSQHFHFQAYGTYTCYNFKKSIDDDIYSFQGYRFKNDISQNEDARIWYLQTTAAGQSDKDGIGGFAYGFGSSKDRRRSQSSHDVITANAFLSAPGDGFTSFQIEPSLGVTSKPKSIYQIPYSNSETYKIVEEYESFDDYVNLETKIKRNQTTKVDSRYGYENAPKFYAFLPLIKI